MLSVRLYNSELRAGCPNFGYATLFLFSYNTDAVCVINPKLAYSPYFCAKYIISFVLMSTQGFRGFLYPENAQKCAILAGKWSISSGKNI